MYIIIVICWCDWNYYFDFAGNSSNENYDENNNSPSNEEIANFQPIAESDVLVQPDAEAYQPEDPLAEESPEAEIPIEQIITEPEIEEVWLRHFVVLK